MPVMTVKDIGNGYPQIITNTFESLEADSAHVVTAANLLKGVLRAVPTAARSFTFDTSANIDTALPNAQVGDSFTVTVFNNSAGANALTFLIGAGQTFFPATLGTVAQNKSCTFLFVKTGTATYNIYQVLGA